MKKLVSILLAITIVMTLAACGGRNAEASSRPIPQSTTAVPLSASKAPDGGAFTDVSADANYASAVAWCYEQGLMAGVGGNRFDPEGTLTRSMLATVLYRAEGEPAVTGAPAFTDTQADTWYSNAVTWANEEGFVQGYGNGVFGTNDPVSVEQLEVILGRYTGSGPEWTGDSAKARAATRGEVAVALYDALAKDEVTPREDGKVLVAYFSATGSTENVAGYIADRVNADLFELAPREVYSNADLDWTDDGSRVNQEHENEALREVELEKDTVENWSEYDTVFIGYPIWWGIAAWPVNDFVKSNDFSGKTVIPFCTSSSSPLGQSGELLSEMAGTGEWLEGYRFSSGASQTTVEEWVDTLDLDASAPAHEEKVLIAYFSMPDNVDDSTVTIGGQTLGNNQYFAQVIQEVTSGDVFRIEPEIPYPTDHSALVDQASEEQESDARPAITGAIENFEDYDTVFIGYPIWWSNMPQIMYTFFDTYDFSGKTIIPFGTHGGSGWAGTPNTIAELEPNATLLDGLSISRDHIQDARQEIIDWLKVS